jgi:hypothetical protein
VAERRYSSAHSMKQLTAPTLPATAQEILPRSREKENPCGRLWKPHSTENMQSTSKEKKVTCDVSFLSA